MRFASRLAFTLTAMTPLAFAPSSRSDVSVPAMSADSIIKRYYLAVGGYTSIAVVTSRRMLGSYSEGNTQASIEILWRRPMLRRVSIHAPGMNYSEGYDGSTWRFDAATGKVARDTGLASDAGRRGAEFDEAFIGYRDRGYAITLVGTKRIADHDTYQLRVRVGGGWEKEYFLDTSTFLIVAMREGVAGKTSPTYSVYEDWRPVEGLLVPHRFVERRTETNAILNTLQWRTIANNVKISDAEIRAPTR